MVAPGGFHHQRPKTARLSTPDSKRLQTNSKPIRGAEHLRTSKGVDRSAVVRWVRMWTAKRIRLDDLTSGLKSFDAHDGESRKHRAKVRKFAAALQAVLLNRKLGWDTAI